MALQVLSKLLWIVKCNYNKTRGWNCENKLYGVMKHSFPLSLLQQLYTCKRKLDRESPLDSFDLEGQTKLTERFYVFETSWICGAG